MHHHCESVRRRQGCVEIITHTRMLFLVHRYMVNECLLVSFTANSHWDVDELDEIPNETHDRKSDGNGLANLNKLYRFVRELQFAGVKHESIPFCEGFVQRVRN